MESLFLGAQWQWVNPQPQGNDIKDMCMTPSGNIIAVGDSKTIIKSEDKGATWQVINLGNDPQMRFRSVCFVNDSLGWISGDKYHTADLYKSFILKTIDGGTSWDTAYYAIDKKLFCVFFIDPLTGWAAGEGGKIIRTIDGGLTWQVLNSGCNKSIYSMHFADENIGVAVGEKGTILFTEKGGQQWEKIAIDMNADLFRVFFKDIHCMNIVGQDGLVLFSGDGRNWRSRPVPAHRHMYDGFFLSPDSGWVCGYSKEVFFTTDGGLSWTPQWVGGSGDYPNYYALCSDGRDELWISGRYGNIIKTTDGGQQWTHLNPGLRSGLGQIRFISETTGWLADNKKNIYKTMDGGHSWVSMVVADKSLYSLFCLDSLHIYACGNQLIVSTNDGGLNWSSYTFSSEEARLEDIFFSDPQHGWAVTESDTIYITQDGGTQWNAFTLPDYAYNNRALYFVDQDNGWLAGDCIYRTTDGGMTWEMQVQGGLYPNDIYFDDLMTGWFILHEGDIYHTTDGGENWNLQLTNAYYIYEMAFTDNQHGWVVGYEGIMWNTSNGGNTWIKSYLPTLEAYRSISSVDQSHIWVCGQDGAILQYTGNGKPFHGLNDDGLTGVEIVIADDGDNFATIPQLHENPEGSNTIRVYSMQGTLVYQSTNQDNFDLNYYFFLRNLKLSAGIYIIQMVKESGVETRKVLID